MHRDQVTEPSDNIINEVLLELQGHFQRNGYDFTSSQLPQPNPELIPGFIPQEIRNETQYDIHELMKVVDQNKPLLNQEQLDVFNAVMDSVNNSNGQMIALDAAGGTGKTFLLTTILASVRAQGR
jgi:type I site-specific restriction endonuclease